MIELDTKKKKKKKSSKKSSIILPSKDIILPSKKDLITPRKVRALGNDYQEQLEAVLRSQNPLDFLRAMSDHKGDAESFNVADISMGKAARESGTLDLAALEAEVDLCNLVREVIEDKSPVPRDVKFDDSSLPEAKNIYEWLTQDHFSGSVMTPFLEQLITGVLLFAEWCPRCSDGEWLVDTHQVNDSYAMFENKVSMLENGTCPNCGSRKSEMVRSGELNFYKELALRCGQRSGKTAMTGGMFFPYQTHRLLKMQNPNAVYGLPGNNMLHMTFCALTYAQAKETLWEFYYGVLVESPWFQKYIALMRHYEDKYGQSILKFNDTFIQFRHRSVLAYPAGPDKRVLRGKTRAAGGVDELGWFDNEANSKKVKTSAREVYVALERSLLTVRAKADKLMRTGFDSALHGYFMNVSSPSSQQDKICELTRQSVGSKDIYGRIRPTWEMNPNIVREDLDAEFKKDYPTAMRDYGAEPPLSNSPFISNLQQVDDSMKNSKRNGIKVKYDTHQTGKGHGKQYTRYGYPVKYRQQGKAGIMALDAGFTNNSFACVTGHREASGTVVVDNLVEVMPQPGVPLNYALIYRDLMLPMIKKFNIQVLLADRWNSLKILHDATEDAEIFCKQYSLKYRDMYFTKTLMEQGELQLPKFGTKDMKAKDVVNYDFDMYPQCFEHKEAEHLILQILTVQDTGAHILKGDGLTDDLWRATALLNWGLLNDDFLEFLAVPDQMSAFNGALGSSRLGSGGGQGNGTGTGGTKGIVLGAVRSIG